jgi:hypothetical protein
METVADAPMEEAVGLLVKEVESLEDIRRLRRLVYKEIAVD